MKREEIEDKLRNLTAHGPPEPAEADLRAMADRVWREVQAPSRARPSRPWWILAPVVAMAAVGLWWFVEPLQPSPGAQRVAVEPDAAVAGAAVTPAPIESDELHEFEETLAEPASSGGMLLEMDETQLRDLLDALHKEKRS